MTRLFSFRLGWLFAASAVTVVPVRQATAALTQEFNETYPVASERRLVVDAVQLELSVTATDREDIGMHMVWNAETDDPEKADERFERLVFEPKVTDNNTVLKLRPEKKGGWFSWGNSPKMPKVRMELQVPRQLDVLVDVTNGEVVMRGVEGNHRIDTTSAPIELENCLGSHSVDSTSGSIVLRGCPGNHRADTTSGDILIQGGAGDVVAESTSGDIRILDFPGAHRADTTSGDITATLASVIDRNLSFDSISGDVVIEVPADLAAHFELDTVSGDLQCTVPEAEILRQERDELSVRTRQGERHIRLDTVSGDIRVGLIANR